MSWYMPADEEELVMALEDGVEFKELLSPVKLENGQLFCKVMQLSDYDVSGRRGVTETGETVWVPADTVIAAVGEELTEIIDLGGIVRNVMVNHRVYGHMEAEINITSRRKVTEFMDDIQNGKSSPLKNITSDYHYHKVEADSEETLDLIEDMLRNKGFLVEDRG